MSTSLKLLRNICFFILLVPQHTFGQLHSVILGRPTDHSITLSLLFDDSRDFRIHYGLVSGALSMNTAWNSALANIPIEPDLDGLQTNSRYYYRIEHKPSGSGITSEFSPEYHFQTQRSSGSSFVFTLEADEHLYDKKGCANLYSICLENQANDAPDFMISLGDIFGDDHRPDSTSSGQMDTLHKVYRPYLGNLCHSVPFYVCLGNHEGENDYYLAQNPPNNIAVWGTQWRQFYYPNPFPDGFYSGNTDIENYGIGNPENYYAWTWGDALFIVLDVYRDQCDTSAKPKNWNWSLGFNQYEWLRTTLENATEEHRFVFAHHVRGQDRGGAISAKKFEWGGYQQDGTTYTFPQNRPDLAMPIHQLFVNYGVDIFFQGHDHVFAHEMLDGVVYQTLPMAADSTYEIGMLANADAFVSDTIDGSGHLRVSVNSACATVDYVKAYLPQDTLNGIHHNAEVAFSYTVGDCLITETASDVPVESEVSLYPNPANNLLVLSGKAVGSIHHWELLSSLGTVVERGSGKTIDTSRLSNGYYLLKMQTPTQIISKACIIQH